MKVLALLFNENEFMESIHFDEIMKIIVIFKIKKKCFGINWCLMSIFQKKKKTPYKVKMTFFILNNPFSYTFYIFLSNITPKIKYILF